MNVDADRYISITESQSGYTVHSAEPIVLNQSDNEEIIANDNIPLHFNLFENYPNPFNPTTTLEYEIPETGDVHIVVYNTLGVEVNELFSGYQTAGHHMVRWSGEGQSGNQVSNGVYLIRLQMGGYASVKKVMLMR